MPTKKPSPSAKAAALIARKQRDNAMYQRGIDDALQVVYKFFSNDYTGVDAIDALKKLKQGKVS